MSATTRPSRKKFRVAVSGTTVDGREISGQHLKDAAANYSPEVYKAPVNMEHYLSPLPSSEFSAMGEVVSMSAEDIKEGPLSGRVALYAEIEPSERMKKLTDEGKKVHTSIELYPRFALNGGPYVAGIAMTDTPASLGTDRLKFTAEQRAQVMKFNNQQGEAPMITDAIEAEVFEMAEQRSDEGKQWFSRVMGILTKNHKTESEQFSQVREVVEGVVTSQADLINQVVELKTLRDGDAQTIQKLTSDLENLKGTLAQQDASTFSRQPAQGGNSGVEQAEF